MRAVVLIGPTGVGKSNLSLELAQDIFEIISVDSVQVYKYFNIGSGKLPEKERKGISHYLLDVVNPDYPYSAGDFCKHADKAVESIFSNARLPLFVGGTGLYIDSYFKGISDIPDIDTSVREGILADLNKNGLKKLYDELKSCDTTFADKVHVNDTQRIIRGLEVFKGTGRPLSSYFSSSKGRASEETLYIGLYEEREILRSHIDKRVDHMIDSGLVDEVSSIRGMGYGSDLKSMKSIGYAEINSFIDGKISYEESVQTIKTNTKRYAKRQMTWFRRNNAVNWFSKPETKKIKNAVLDWYNHLN